MTDQRLDIFMDTEFSNGPNGLTLISLAMVTNEGNSFYAVSSEFTAEQCIPYVQKKVLPQLKGETPISRDAIREGIIDLIGNKRPSFWGYCPAFDWVLMSGLWRGIDNMPEKWPKYCLCVRQLALDHNVPSSSLPPKPHTKHHALEDALWAKECHEVLLNRLGKSGVVVRRSDTST